MPLLFMNDRNTIDRKMKLGQELPQRKRAASPNKLVMMREYLRICKSEQEKSQPAIIEPEVHFAELPHQVAIDIQDNRTLIGDYREPPSEVK
jgi:hypothetical protein